MAKVGCSMAEQFERILRTAGRRTSMNVLLEQCARTLVVAGGVAAAAVIVQSALGVYFIVGWTGLGFAAAAAVATLVLWVRYRPSAMATAGLIDRRLLLRERFSTTLATAGTNEPFAQAARQEARQTAQRVSARGRFPIRLSSSSAVKMRYDSSSSTCTECCGSLGNTVHLLSRSDSYPSVPAAIAPTAAPYIIALTTARGCCSVDSL